ncbi:ganglioside GM2 activator-like [Centruroides sculpturatus]|uniref:ganglioside GM2 activator-like n=1 Tax=Centruroides sculpturatus TaxID=218467 RepID=UPI000C6CC914|nr:ganglioside GM2 activator-like [Centruroides sculpturatus]
MNYIILILLVTSLCQILPANTYDASKVNSSSWHPISKRDSPIEWKSCNDDGPVRMTSLVLFPNPIPLRGTISLGGHIIVDRPIGSPIKVTVKVYKNMLAWVYVKEINVGNICDLFPPYCPDTLMVHDLPCRCPIKAL